MKKFLSILVVLAAVSGSVMATEKDPKEPVAMAVVKSESGFKIFYKGNKVQDVTVTIYGENGATVFKERIKNLESFIRPYNLNSLNDGEYTVELTSADGKLQEKVSYSRDQRSSEVFNLIHLRDSEKYMLTVPNSGKNTLYLKIYNSEDRLVYNSTEQITSDFARIFDLKKIGKGFRFEVTDRVGTQSLTSD